MACHADVNEAESVVFSACEPEVSGWGYPELGADSFVRGYVIFVT